MRADLHVHSTASDGTTEPADLVALALRRGLSVLAIADHDSVEGIDEAIQASEGTRLTLIPALELSAVEDGLDVHILGYWIDHKDARLARRLADMRDARRRRAERMLGLLSQAGYHVELEDVLHLSDGGAVGRSHVARALVGAGHAETVRDAFERLIGRGKPYYVAKDARCAADAIAVITDAGGIAVVAHPGISGVDHLLPAMIDAGLGGIEAYHADHTAEQREHYTRIAEEAGVLVTGGTDFHGPAAPNPELGSIELPSGAVEALLFWRNATALVSPHAPRRAWRVLHSLPPCRRI